jgi:hypothetical protein
MYMKYRDRHGWERGNFSNTGKCCSIALLGYQLQLSWHLLPGADDGRDSAPKQACINGDVGGVSKIKFRAYSCRAKGGAQVMIPRPSSATDGLIDILLHLSEYDI